jgi:hypothetical protein
MKPVAPVTAIFMWNLVAGAIPAHRITPGAQILTESKRQKESKGVRVLIVVEGTNDIEFLRRISRMLHGHDKALPDLAAMEQRGELIFIPFGGGEVASWTHRLAPLGKPEFFLFDHELPPETDIRRAAADEINRRPGCGAVLTRKRSLENYLHPQAILEAGGFELQFDDFEQVAEMVAKQRYQQEPGSIAWELLPPRARKRIAQRSKRWLNTQVVERMTLELLQARDPQGEVISWLTTIQRLAHGSL